LAVVGRVADFGSDGLTLDFALVGAVDVRALDTVAAFGRRAALAVAAGPVVAAEGAVGREGPIVAVAGRIAELTGVGRVDLAGVERFDPDRAAARFAPLGGAALVRSAAVAVATIPAVGTAPIAAEVVTLVTSDPADAAGADRLSM